MRGGKQFLFLFLCVLFLATLPGEAKGEEIVLFPSEDSWVNQANPGAAYGGGTYISVRDRSGFSDAFLKLSDEDLLPLHGAQIESASLWIYQYQATYSPGDVVNVRAVMGNWDEDGLTWDNKPPVSGIVASGLELTDGNNCWRSFQGLEGLVDSWRSGENFGLCLETRTDGIDDELFARFYSSETTGGLRPYFRVNAVRAAPEPVSACLFMAGSAAMALRRLRIRPLRRD